MMSFIPDICFQYALTILTNYLCSLLIFIFSSRIKVTKQIVIYSISSAAIITVLCTYLRTINFAYYGLVCLVLTVLTFLLIGKEKYYISIPTAFISIGINYCFEIICVFLLGTLFYLVGYREVNLLTEFSSTVLQFIMLFMFTKIRRNKNGFTFFEDKNNFGIGLIISGPVIVMTCLQKADMPDIFLSIVTIGIVISAIGLFLWIRSAFTRYYRKRLKLRAEEYSKIELAEKQNEISKLLTENASLSSIIHLDNHLINKLESTLNNYKNDELIKDLLTLSKQRNEYVNNKIISDKLLPTTGNDDIDTAISDMYIKAASRGIDFTLNANCDVNYLIHNIIEQTDFEKLIRRCITNSIVDIENNPNTNGKILITISKPNDIYEFTIMDNGVYKEDSIKPISEIIEKTKAGIKTNKFDNNDYFTKSLTIHFDGLKDELNNKY